MQTIEIGRRRGVRTSSDGAKDSGASRVPAGGADMASNGWKMEDASRVDKAQSLPLSFPAEGHALFFVSGHARTHTACERSAAACMRVCESCATGRCVCGVIFCNSQSFLT